MLVPQTLPRWRRVAWMMLIWLGSVLTLGAVSLVIRFWLHA
jgi:hypothetical protein